MCVDGSFDCWEKEPEIEYPKPWVHLVLKSEVQVELDRLNDAANEEQTTAYKMMEKNTDLQQKLNEANAKLETCKEQRNKYVRLWNDLQYDSVDSSDKIIKRLQAELNNTEGE